MTPRVSQKREFSATGPKVARQQNHAPVTVLRQIAAIPTRRSASGAIEVLLVTSRETQRWVIPKGWPMPGLSDRDAAIEEAWEEAGVQGTASSKIIGTFTYDKRRQNDVVPVVVEVYLLVVTEIAEDWPEAAERQRAWYAPVDAARLVHEPELQVLLAKVA
ncbi:MAG: NUDIX hydrolase [Hyphomicrobiaceae bacterium]